MHTASSPCVTGSGDELDGEGARKVATPGTRQQKKITTGVDSGAEVIATIESGEPRVPVRKTLLSLVDAQERRRVLHW